MLSNPKRGTPRYSLTISTTIKLFNNENNKITFTGVLNQMMKKQEIINVITFIIKARLSTDNCSKTSYTKYNNNNAP